MRITLFFAGTVALLSVLYVVGYSRSLLWEFWWYDIVLHTLGGIGIGLLVARVAQLVGMSGTLMWAVCTALCIGIAWEVFEYSLGLPRSVFLSYAVDTTKDLLMDMTGAVIGVSIARSL